MGSLKAYAPGLAYAHMRNAANNTVAPTTDTIQSAMTDFRSFIVSGAPRHFRCREASSTTKPRRSVQATARTCSMEAARKAIR